MCEKRRKVAVIPENSPANKPIQGLVQLSRLQSKSLAEKWAEFSDSHPHAPPKYWGV